MTVSKAEYNSLRVQVETHIKNGEANKAKAILVNLINERNEAEVAKAILRTIKHPSAKALLTKILEKFPDSNIHADLSDVKPLQSASPAVASRSQQKIILPVIAVLGVIVLGIIIGIIILSRTQTLPAKVDLPESTTFDTSGMYIVKLHHPTGWQTSPRDQANIFFGYDETIVLLANSAEAMDAFKTGKPPQGNQVYGYLVISQKAINQVPPITSLNETLRYIHQIAGNAKKRGMSEPSSTTINKYNASVSSGTVTVSGDQEGAAGFVLMDTGDSLVTLMLIAEEGKSSLFEGTLRSMAESLEYTSTP